MIGKHDYINVKGVTSSKEKKKTWLEVKKKYMVVKKVNGN